MAPAACWASWADALPMLQERLPVEVQNAALDDNVEVGGRLCEVRVATAGPERQGFIGRLLFGALQMGASIPTDRIPTRLGTLLGFVPLQKVRRPCTIVSMTPGPSFPTPRSDLGKVAGATARYRSQERVWSCLGLPRPPHSLEPAGKQVRLAGRCERRCASW